MEIREVVGARPRGRRLPDKLASTFMALAFGEYLFIPKPKHTLADRATYHTLTSWVYRWNKRNNIDAALGVGRITTYEGTYYYKISRRRKGEKHVA